MLLKSIKLNNFRQFVNDSIDFSTDENQNVTLIIGENGTGKTTFAQAFFWCLYGETSFSDKNLLNRTVSEEMTPDQTATVRVELKLFHGSVEYTIIRTQEYKKSYSNKVTGANTVINISMKLPDGNTRFLKPLECETEIRKILPKELSNYFFFDGERIEKMSKEIAGGRKSYSFASAVSGLTGLNGTLAALDHLSPTKLTKSVIGKFNNDYVGDSAGKIRALTSRIEELQRDLDYIENRLGEIDGEIEVASRQKNEFVNELKQYEDAKKLQTEKEQLLKDRESNERILSQFVKTMSKDFNDDMTAFFSTSLVKQALEMLSRSDFEGKDIPAMHCKTISYLLKRGNCICGTPLLKGSNSYKRLEELMEYLPPQSIGVTVGSFRKDSRNMYLDDNDLYESIRTGLDDVEQQESIIESQSTRIREIDDILEGGNVSAEINRLQSQINSCNKTITDREEERKDLVFQKGSKTTEKSLKETSRSELALVDANNLRIERCKAYALRLYEDLSREYKTKETSIRNELEKSINEIFTSIYDGGMSLTIDEKYNIKVHVEKLEDVETSTAQSISVIFAFVSAIIKMARENRVKNQDELYSEPYPLVMDAPLSAFDKKRIKAICNAIPETAEQVIIFIKDTDGELAEEYLSSRVKVRHHFVKIDEFNTRLD